MLINVGIDASRNRSGGAVAHLVGILENAVPENYGIGEVHLWSYKALIEQVPDYPWLIKHCPQVLEKSLPHQVWWQYYHLQYEVKHCGCNLLFNTDAGSVCKYRPSVTLSQDMLPFEKSEMKRFWGKVAWLRLILLRFIQSSALRKAVGAIFLTDYAARIIQKKIGNLKRVEIIAHGIGEEFKQVGDKREYSLDINKPIELCYVSNTEMYKHQWQVVKAIGQIRKEGFQVSLTLVGGGRGQAQRLLEHQLKKTDPGREFVKQEKFVPHSMIPELLANADIFIFASSCENMPITLLEAMASGLPIACSDRGPMPEVLQDGGVYFDPENAESIKMAVIGLLSDADLQKRLGIKAKKIAEGFTWLKCAEETFSFLSECARQNS